MIHTCDGACSTEADHRRNSDNENATSDQEARDFVGFHPLPEVARCFAGVGGNVDDAVPDVAHCITGVGGDVDDAVPDVPHCFAGVGGDVDNSVPASATGVNEQPAEYVEGGCWIEFCQFLDLINR